MICILTIYSNIHILIIYFFCNCLLCLLMFNMFMCVIFLCIFSLDFLHQKSSEGQPPSTRAGAGEVFWNPPGSRRYGMIFSPQRIPQGIWSNYSGRKYEPHESCESYTIVASKAIFSQIFKCLCKKALLRDKQVIKTPFYQNLYCIFFCGIILFPWFLSQMSNCYLHLLQVS